MKECITCNGHGWLLTDEVKPCPDCWIPDEPEGGSGWLDDDDSPLPIALRRAAGRVENPSEVFTPTLTSRLSSIAGRALAQEFEHALTLKRVAGSTRV